MHDEKRIIFFDGHCNLCDGTINFIVSRDKNHLFYVASLQGKTATEVLAQSDIGKLETIIFKDSDGKKYYRSQAVFRIFALLGGMFTVVSWFRFLPRQFTDTIYDWISAHRYSFFGKKDHCRLPTSEEKAYFLT